MFKQGDTLHYVTATGVIHTAEALEDERFALIKLKVGDVELSVGTFHVFRSLASAERAAKSRRA